MTNRQDGEVKAKVVLLADGVNSPLATKTGFRTDLKPEHVALAVKEIIELAPEVIEQRFGVAVDGRCDHRGAGRNDRRDGRRGHCIHQ